MGAHEVCQCKICIWCPHHHRTAGIQTSDRFSGKIVICRYAAAIRSTFQRLAIQHAVQFVLVYFHTKALCTLAEEVHPGIQIGGAVIAMYHGHGHTVGCCDHIDLFVYFLHSLFQDYHCENRGSGGDITGADSHTVGSYHSGSRITLGRTHRNTGLQSSGRIQ